MTETPDAATPNETRLGHLAQDLPFVTRILRAHVLVRTAPFFDAHEAAGGEVALLNLIGINPGLSQKDLAQMVVLKKSALTKLVNEFEASGLIERRKEGADKRLNALYLTPRGAARLARMRPDMMALQEELLSALSPGERVMLFELLWRLIRSYGGPSAPEGRGSTSSPRLTGRP